MLPIISGFLQLVSEQRDRIFWFKVSSVLTRPTRSNTSRPDQFWAWFNLPIGIVAVCFIKIEHTAAQTKFLQKTWFSRNFPAVNQPDTGSSQRFCVLWFDFICNQIRFVSSGIQVQFLLLIIITQVRLLFYFRIPVFWSNSVPIFQTTPVHHFDFSQTTNLINYKFCVQILFWPAVFEFSF